MDYTDTRTVTAFYETRAAADARQAALVDIGVPSSDITIVEGADETEPTRTYEEKGFFETIGDYIMGTDDQHIYNEGLKRGGYLLTARVASVHYDMALDALDTDDAVDLDERSETWRSEGWAGVPSSTATAGAAAGLAGATATQRGNETIEVMEENVKVGKRDVSHGRVRVRSYVVEDQVSEDVTLHSEHVDVERRPVDRKVGHGTDAFQDRTIEAEETAEEAVVSKEARVTEEIDLKRRADQQTETVTETVRHTEVEIDDERAGKSRDNR